MIDSFIAPQSRLRSTWNESKILLRGKLTDRKIEYYRKRGFYSNEFREMRRDLWMKRKSKRDDNRIGNFVKTGDGRLIYSPI